MGQDGFALSAFGEWTAHDPFGRPREVDGPPAALGSPVRVAAPRGGYASLRLLVSGAGEYRLSASARGGIEVDLFRAWYHHMHEVEGRPAEYWPDALVPVKSGARAALPDPDNRVPGQTFQEYWVDFFAPAEARPGAHQATLRLAAAGAKVELPVVVEVLDRELPAESCVTMDNNTYGCRWLPGTYPKAFAGAGSGEKFWACCIELLHGYYRLSREHRTVLHNLGYGHSGQFDPIYGPRAAGAGRERHLEGWELFDRHYGPLLDGSAFAAKSPGLPGPRRPAAPVWGVYTPINPDWPASYLWWGEPGYEAEFVRCVGEFDAHLRERGWTGSRIEFFFNHKKRYRWFEWDGDEQKDGKDNAYHAAMLRLWEKATLPSPVNWVYRADASWQMKRQFAELGGHRNFWVCGGFVSWYPEEIRAVLARGETAWWYGGYPPITAPTSAALQNLWKTWARGLDGFCHWSAASPGKDPWFDCDGAATGPLYPGERFGLAGPIPSVRLKVLRNGIQDVDLLDAAARASGRLEAIRSELSGRIPIALWEKPPRAARELPPEDWDSINLSAEHEPVMQAAGGLRPDWWTAVREAARGGEVRR